MDAPPDTPVIRVEGLVNRFGGQIVHDGLSFEVRPHEIMGVVGGSGTGKTVLLRTILGLQRPQAGMVEVYGRNIHELSAAERVAMSRSYGVTFQSGALISSLTVAQNIQLPLREAYSMPEDALDELVQLNLSLVGLAPDDAEKYPAQLSGGMVKRAALARALSPRTQAVVPRRADLGARPHFRGGLRCATVIPSRRAEAHGSHDHARPRQPVPHLRPRQRHRRGPHGDRHAAGDPRQPPALDSRVLSRAACARARRRPRMDRETNYVVVGAFVLLVIGMAVSFVYWYTEQKEKRTYQRYEIYYDGTVSGLTAGSPVRYLGVDVGKVARITLERQQRKRVEVIADIDETAPIDARTRALLSLQGVTGLLFIDLEEDPKLHRIGTPAAGSALPGDPIGAVRLGCAAAQAPGTREPRHRARRPHGPAVQRRERPCIQGHLAECAAGERPRADAAARDRRAGNRYEARLAGRGQRRVGFAHRDQ